MNNLAEALRKSGKLNEAIELQARTLEIRISELGQDHPDTLRSKNNLGISYLAVGKMNEAIPLLEATLKGMKAELPAGHPNLVNCRMNLGKAYCQTGMGEEAVTVLTEGVAILRNSLKVQKPFSFARLLNQVGADLMSCDQFSAAGEMFQESLEIQEELYPSGWTTFETQSLLGEALMGCEKYEEAESLMIKGYEGLKSQLSSKPNFVGKEIPKALKRLVKLYKLTDQTEQLETYSKLLEDASDQKSTKKD